MAKVQQIPTKFTQSNQVHQVKHSKTKSSIVKHSQLQSNSSFVSPIKFIVKCEQFTCFKYQYPLWFILQSLSFSQILSLGFWCIYRLQRPFNSRDFRFWSILQILAFLKFYSTPWIMVYPLVFGVSLSLVFSSDFDHFLDLDQFLVSFINFLDFGEFLGF